MNSATLDQAISTAMQLPPEQQEILIDILSKRRMESRRQEIRLDANQSLLAFREGRFKALSAEEAIADLHSALKDKE